MPLLWMAGLIAGPWPHASRKRPRSCPVSPWNAHSAFQSTPGFSFMVDLVSAAFTNRFRPCFDRVGDAPFDCKAGILTVEKAIRGYSLSTRVKPEATTRAVFYRHTDIALHDRLPRR